MKRTVAAFIAVVVLVCAVRGYAHRGGGVVVEVQSEHGEMFRAIPYRHSEYGGMLVTKSYLEARRGKNYSIVIRNNSSARIGVVVAVDGRNVINGQKSFLGSSEPMYMIEAYGTTRLDGWRTDRDTVHQFYFTEPADSYSARAFGDSSAMGVIAVAAFRERQPEVYLPDRMAGKDAAGTPGIPAPPEKGRPESEAAGTGFGGERYSPVVNVPFESEGRPFSKTLLKYEWRETLCRKGIMNCGEGERNRLWDEGRYAPFPPGYPH